MDSRLKTHVPDGAQLPLIVEPMAGVDPASYHDEIMTLAREELPRAGAILFRGFPLDGVDAFRGFAAGFGHPLLTYEFGSTPRSKVTQGVYTSTEYPPHQQIPLHNEQSYTRDWPMKIWFYCHQVAPEGRRDADRRQPRDLPRHAVRPCATVRREGR